MALPGWNGLRVRGISSCAQTRWAWPGYAQSYLEHGAHKRRLAHIRSADHVHVAPLALAADDRGRRGYACRGEGPVAYGVGGGEAWFLAKLQDRAGPSAGVVAVSKLPGDGGESGKKHTGTSAGLSAGTHLPQSGWTPGAQTPRSASCAQLRPAASQTPPAGGGDGGCTRGRRLGRCAECMGSKLAPRGRPHSLRSILVPHPFAAPSASSPDLHPQCARLGKQAQPHAPTTHHPPWGARPQAAGPAWSPPAQWGCGPPCRAPAAGSRMQ